jgi:hypothetical protein
MKKLLFIIALISLASFVNAQTPNFFVDGSVWTYYTGESYEPGMCYTQSTLEKDSIQGDTLINSKFYKKLFVKAQTTYQPYYPCINPNGTTPVGTTEKFLRYDTLTKKVFMINDTGTVVPERLLYNFNLIAGDTVPLYNNHSFSNCNIIDSVNYISFFGIQTRKFYLPHYSDGNYIIEGMGGSNGLTYFNPNATVVSGGFFFTSLQCFKSGDSIYYNPIGSGCPSFILVGISEIKNLNSELLFYPNPATNNITIESLHKAIIEILNIQGQTISQQLKQGKTDIDISSLAKGVYILRLLSNDKTVVARIVKE